MSQPLYLLDSIHLFYSSSSGSSSIIQLLIKCEKVKNFVFSLNISCSNLGKICNDLCSEPISLYKSIESSGDTAPSFFPWSIMIGSTKSLACSFKYSTPSSKLCTKPPEICFLISASILYSSTTDALLHNPSPISLGKYSSGPNDSAPSNNFVWYLVSAPLVIYPSTVPGYLVPYSVTANPPIL